MTIEEKVTMIVTGNIHIKIRTALGMVSERTAPVVPILGIESGNEIEIGGITEIVTETESIEEDDRGVVVLDGRKRPVTGTDIGMMKETVIVKEALEVRLLELADQKSLDTKVNLQIIRS